MDGWHQTAVLEEQKNESAEEVDAEDESNTSETKPEAVELGEKPDINDAPEKESKVIATVVYFLCYILCDLTPPWILLLFGTNFFSTAEHHIL